MCVCLLPKLPRRPRFPISYREPTIHGILFPLAYQIFILTGGLLPFPSQVSYLYWGSQLAPLICGILCLSHNHFCFQNILSTLSLKVIRGRVLLFGQLVVEQPMLAPSLSCPHAEQITYTNDFSCHLS